MASRAEMVANRDRANRKKACYESKIQRNSQVKSDVASNYATCLSCSTTIVTYCNESVIFGELAGENHRTFANWEQSYYTSILEQLDSHLAAERDAAAQEAADWQSAIDKYDEEERKRKEEEEKKKKEEEQKQDTEG